MSNPNHQVTWLPPRPSLVIQRTGGSGRMCYSETMFEVVCDRELSAADFRRLDECNLLGMGQCYDVLRHDAFTETVPPVVIDKRTSKVLDEPPTNYAGEPFTTTHDYEYHRYAVRRICDSGD